MNKTIEDIIKCIRDENPPKYYPSQYGGGLVPNKMRDLANRIEAAYEYERERSRRVVRMASANGTPAPWRLNIDTARNCGGVEFVDMLDANGRLICTAESRMSKLLVEAINACKEMTE